MEYPPLGSVPSPKLNPVCHWPRKPESPVALRLPFPHRVRPTKALTVSRHYSDTRSLKHLSAVAAGQVRRQQREEAAAQQQAGPGVLRQPGAGEAAGQRLAAFPWAAAPPAPAARLEHCADRPLPVQPADLHDRRQPPVCRVRWGVSQLTGLLLRWWHYRARAAGTSEEEVRWLVKWWRHRLFITVAPAVWGVETHDVQMLNGFSTDNLARLPGDVFGCAPSAFLCVNGQVYLDGSHSQGLAPNACGVTTL